MNSSGLTPYVASLRVYEPIEVFSEIQQRIWLKSSSLVNSIKEEQVRSLKRTVNPFAPLSANDEVHVVELSGKKYYCPWTTQARIASALLDFKSIIPTKLFSYFIGESKEKELFFSSQEFENKIPHIKSVNWNIPPSWFALFKTDERIYGNHEGFAFTYFHTRLGDAIKRGRFLHNIVLGAFGAGPIEEEIKELNDWLTNFNQDSIIELDYGGLAVFLEKVLISEGKLGLEEDTSVEDLQISLAGLASADGNKAGRGYNNLISRWQKVSRFQQAF